MKTTRVFLGLVMLCGTAFGTPAPTITTTPTNGPTTVTVHARTKDGKMPVGVECEAATYFKLGRIPYTCRATTFFFG